MLFNKWNLDKGLVSMKFRFRIFTSEAKQKDLILLFIYSNQCLALTRVYKQAPCTAHPQLVHEFVWEWQWSILVWFCSWNWQIAHDSQSPKYLHVSSGKRILALSWYLGRHGTSQSLSFHSRKHCQKFKIRWKIQTLVDTLIKIWAHLKCGFKKHPGFGVFWKD